MLAIFPSPVNYSPPGRVWLVTGTGKPLAFFYCVCTLGLQHRVPAEVIRQIFESGTLRQATSYLHYILYKFKKLNIRLSTGRLLSCIIESETFTVQYLALLDKLCHSTRKYFTLYSFHLSSSIVSFLSF